ncbi:hypothetical protein BBO99_00008923 [Phytophthora kernoviae]|uniref:Dynamin-type G domain-containing protein n=2 Tax=Phytophthora kernoviae TaxID=325452 RepID=A0A3R7JZV7_9STRA|nr:hypothetical protein G195_010141 [Phytophthora kernoviae 00238/432]KAG2519279.1 hypothetical protein JM18_005458 [Phytophthora kernoviae]RLN38490.1 hypothetical protein BBI17_008942 [Phytophthora kernoviae]RLN74459.1 hypothetical protein BBO99_00008923 [Phytophthora kernoviae]
MEGVTSVLKDVELALPQIVVVGQESSGKSSVLESLAMMPLFPRKEDICTRLPIHLKMRHVPKRDVVDGDQELMPHHSTPPSEDAIKHQIKMKLVYSDDREPVTSEKELTAEQAAERMSEWMEMIVKEENEEKKLKGVVDHVLEIEVRSPHVPNLNLIDLPGIVAGRLIDEPDDMMQRTRALVEKYLQMPHTLVLAVIPAFERVRNSQAFQLVQQYDLMDSTIGVLTMVDRSLDTSNPEGPLAEIMNRLDGTSRDIVYLKEGYVAVKNRDTRVSPEWSLGAFKTEENVWLEENLPGYIERKLASSSVLATKLEKMLADHVRAVWVPHTLIKINSEKVEAEKKLVELGINGQDIVDSFLKGTSPAAGRQKMLDLIQKVIEASEKEKVKSRRLGHFVNLHLFFASILWERLNELLIDEEDLVQRLEKSFLEFDPANAQVLKIAARTKEMSSERATEVKTLANNVELYLDSKGFQNTTLDELYLPPVVSPTTSSKAKSLDRPFAPKEEEKPDKPSADSDNGVFHEISEFESRLFFAITSHLVAPLLQPVCNVGELDRKMREYVSRHPKVSASRMHIFQESTSGERKKLTMLVKRLGAASLGLQSTSNFQ